jgi:NADH:ubiquinone oxidoreductase subunit B-like Fe-S oxidoreductase
VRSPEDYDLAVCVVSFQTTLSSRLVCDRFQSYTDSSLRDVQSSVTVGTWSRAPSLLTQQDQE